MKTVERQRSGGSNPSASAKIARSSAVGYFCGGGGMKMLRIFSFLPPPNLPSGEALSLRSERAASCSCLSISDNGKQIHGIKLQSPHYQYVLFSTCSFRTLRDARKALVTFVSSYLSAFYKKPVLQHLPLPLRESFSDVRESEVLETEYAPDGSRIYRPRIIDIDILLYGNRTVETPTLKIPHPQIEERDSAKRLLRQIL